MQHHKLGKGETKLYANKSLKKNLTLRANYQHFQNQSVNQIQTVNEEVNKTESINARGKRGTENLGKCD